jgi:hypothetical protein
MEELEIDEETIESAPDFVTCYPAELEPIVKLSPDWILDRIDEERFTEDGNDHDKVYELLSKIDFSAFNESCPKLYYPTGRKFEITKADFYEAL